jgi:N-acetylmuramoyl-L-alanine amidase
VKARTRLLLLGGLVALLPGLLGVDRPRGLGDVRDVRTWSHEEFTRVVVELSRPVEAEVRRLGANQQAGKPARLYVDLEGIWVGRNYKDGIPIGDGLLQGVRVGQNTKRTTRVVIDLERYQRHRLLMLRSPDRVVVDVYGPRMKTSRKPTDARPGAPLRGVRKVVIDAGHGGRDPGAIGVGGVREKDVNLKLAKRLASRLEARGFEVVMTRRDDRFLDLEQRTVLAESAGGDVFVSVHANASRRRGTRGIEIYYLDEDHERHSLDVAARENDVPRNQLDTLQRTLAKLRVSETGEHSKTLAGSVHENIVAGLSRNRRTRTVPDLGVKKGPFYVLFLSSMPSILVEAGFLTNRQDAKLLGSDLYLDLLADTMADGIAGYRKRIGTRVAGARR